MANIQGKISSSLDIAMQDVTMSFHATPVFYSSSVFYGTISIPGTLLVTLPPNQENDVIIMGLMVGSAASSSIECPSFDSIIRTSASNAQMEWFWKRVTASQATQPVSCSGQYFYAIASVYRGCDTASTPPYEEPVTVLTGFGTDVYLPSVTASSDNSALFSFRYSRGSGLFSSEYPPRGWTDLYETWLSTGPAAGTSCIGKLYEIHSGSVIDYEKYGSTQGNHGWATLNLFLKGKDVSKNYTTYTDSNGEYTQSVPDGWHGIINPIKNNYIWFDKTTTTTVTESYIPIVSASGNITENTIGVKNYTSGSGHPDNPYYILDHEDMHNTRFRFDNDRGHYRLGADIDLSPISNWMPIPFYSGSYNIFRGSLKGNNHTIRNMTITSIPADVNGASKYVGLFGEIQASESFSDIILESCSVVLYNPFSTTTTSANYIGVLCGEYQVLSSFGALRNNKIKNCVLKYERILASSTQPDIQIGGLAGRANTYILSCSVEDSNIHAYHSGSGIELNVSGLCGTRGSSLARSVQYSFVKNSSIFGNVAGQVNTNTKVSALSGYVSSPYNCYALNNKVSSSATCSQFIFADDNVTSRNSIENNYVAGTDWGDTPINSRLSFQLNTSGFPTPTIGSWNYYESGAYSGNGPTNIIEASTEQLKNPNYFSSSFNFIDIWDSSYIISRPETAKFDQTLNLSASFSGYNFRNLVTGSVLSGDTAFYGKIILANDAHHNWLFTDCSIMERVGTSFSGSNMKRVYFNNGNEGATVYSGSDLESDIFVYKIENGKDYFVHIVKGNAGYYIPFIQTNYATASFLKGWTTDFSMTENYSDSILNYTSSYGVKQIIGINLTTSSSEPELNYGYPFLNYQEFPIPPSAAPGLTLYYDSRIGYTSASNTWTDLSGYGVNATTVNTYPTGGHLYFGTEYGAASASFTGLLVSRSFGIEIWTAPKQKTEKMYLFSTISGTFPRIDAYVTQSKVYFGYQAGETSSIFYMTSSILNMNKFNHIAFHVSPFTKNLWSNGNFQPSSSYVLSSDAWSGGTIGIANTTNINPYFGYIDVFKVWNNEPLNKPTTNTYYSGKNYFPDLTVVNFPQAQIVKKEDGDGQGIYTGSTFTYGELDVDVFIPSASNPNANRYMAMYWLIQTNDVIGSFYPESGTLEQDTYEILTYQPAASASRNTTMGARKTYSGSVLEYDFFITPTNVFTYDIWTKWSIKRNSTSNEFFTGGANQIAYYINDVLFQTGSNQMGNPSDGTDSPCADSLIYSSSKYMIMQVYSSGSKFRNLRINGIEQNLSGWTQLPSDKFEYVVV